MELTVIRATPRRAAVPVRGTVLTSEAAGRFTVRAVCACGALAVRPMELPAGTSLAHARKAVDALLASTIVRCGTPDEAPACRAHRARRPVLVR